MRPLGPNETKSGSGRATEPLHEDKSAGSGTPSETTQVENISSFQLFRGSLEPRSHGNQPLPYRIYSQPEDLQGREPDHVVNVFRGK